MGDGVEKNPKTISCQRVNYHLGYFDPTAETLRGVKLTPQSERDNLHFPSRIRLIISYFDSQIFHHVD